MGKIWYFCKSMAKIGTKCPDVGGKKADKDVLYISSSNLDKNNCDDQKIFSLPGLVLIEYSYFCINFQRLWVLLNHAFICLIA